MTNQNARFWRLAIIQLCHSASLLEALDPAARNLSVQPSLLRGVDLSKPVPRRYDPGMDDFVDSEAFEKLKRFFLRERGGRKRFFSRERGGRLKLPPTLPLPSALEKKRLPLLERYTINKIIHTRIVRTGNWLV